MTCGTIEKMPTEVRPNEKVSAQNGQSRIASPTVGPGLAVARGAHQARRAALDAPPGQHQEQRDERPR